LAQEKYLVTYLGDQVQFGHRDEGQSFQKQSLCLPNQEWLARLWLAIYIGLGGERGMYYPTLYTSSHALRHRTLGLRYIADHPYITFLKNKSIQFHLSIFFLMPENHFFCAMLKGLGLAMLTFAYLKLF
jgi:hypothetical protein